MNNLVTVCAACHRSIHNDGYYAPTAGLPEPTGSELNPSWDEFTRGDKIFTYAVFAFVVLFAIVMFSWVL